MNVENSEEPRFFFSSTVTGEDTSMSLEISDHFQWKLIKNIDFSRDVIWRKL